MILLNYAHPLTEVQLEQINTMLNAAVEVRDIEVQVDRVRPLAQVAIEFADAANLTAAEWQSADIILNPPGLAPLTLALVAEIHGRSGHFPTILNVRPVAESTPTRYEIGEILNLQSIREAARLRRQ